MPKKTIYSAADSGALKSVSETFISKPESIASKIDVVSLPKPDSLAAVDQIKTAVKKYRLEQPLGNKLPLGHAYNQVAQTLGFKCWDALLAAAKKQQVLPTAAANYTPLSTKEEDDPVRASSQQEGLSRTIRDTDNFSPAFVLSIPSHEDFLAAISKEPYLTHNGIRFTADWQKTAEENRQEYLNLRSELEATGLEQFRLCCEWLKGCNKIKTLNRSMDSYTLKRRVKRWATLKGVEDDYVSNGCFHSSSHSLRLYT